MKQRYINNEKEFALRAYFFEVMGLLSVIGIILSWIEGDTSSISYEANALTLLISIEFDKVLNGKDVLFQFRRIKDIKKPDLIVLNFNHTYCEATVSNLHKLIDLGYERDNIDMTDKYLFIEDSDYFVSGNDDYINDKDKEIILKDNIFFYK